MEYAVHLSDEERAEFTEHFYAQWDAAEIGAPEDTCSPYPFGCPWLYDADCALYGDTIEEKARNYFVHIKVEIIRAIANCKQ